MMVNRMNALRYAREGNALREGQDACMHARTGDRAQSSSDLLVSYVPRRQADFNGMYVVFFTGVVCVVGLLCVWYKVSRHNIKIDTPGNI